MYADHNGNAAMDAGEEFAVTANGGWPQGTHAAVADSAGRFAFQDLPRGSYSLSFAASDWSFPWTYLEIGR